MVDTYYKAVVPRVFTQEDGAEETSEEFMKKGWVVIQVMNEDGNDAREMIASQYNKIIKTQPLRNKFRLAHHPKHKPDFPKSKEDIVKWLTQPCKTIKQKKQRKEARNGWPWHVSFGAPADSASFNTEEVWKFRQNEFMYQVASTLMSEKKLWVSLDRQITKLPCATKKDMEKCEFIHLDNDPHRLPTPNDLKGLASEIGRENLQGKL